MTTTKVALDLRAGTIFVEVNHDNFVLSRSYALLAISKAQTSFNTSIKVHSLAGKANKRSGSYIQGLKVDLLELDNRSHWHRCLVSAYEVTIKSLMQSSCIVQEVKSLDYDNI